MERGETAARGSGASPEDVVRTALDAIQDLKQAGLSPALARQADALAQALSRTAPAVAASALGSRRRFGAFAGKFTLGPEFFEPLSDEERRAWGEA
ncbi:hypothetical protein [Methylobacterium soli]|uniref:Uncharacterized protein n=1 Tax=Methylobacterium soli TaxID=553447 RepID=A0A6L3SZA7_9HYPH|nr:hypothetical protein [Methylobacterium soli]KAB1075851.1 hypothetical protein F6X53_24575 [Methylobacterium soli]